MRFSSGPTKLSVIPGCYIVMSTGGVWGIYWLLRQEPYGLLTETIDIRKKKCEMAQGSFSRRQREAVEREIAWERGCCIMLYYDLW